MTDLLQTGQAFSAELADWKQRIAVPDYGWYPYSTLSALPHLASLLAPVSDEVRESMDRLPVADIGCGDGDLAMLFARLGCSVDAIDHAETNFNQLRGVELLRRAMGADVQVHDVDLDRPFSLPRRDYSLALFLGTLYHLKNPLYVLETLALHADWCILSTRIAQVTPDGKSRMEGQALAYLLGTREANNDPTNYWIFSLAGLLRLLERTGWMVMGYVRLGCLQDSNPVQPEADERVMVIVKSRTRHPGLHVCALDGWHGIENDGFRWTAKRFSLEVALPEPAHEFALRFSVPEVALASGPVQVSCTIAGEPAGAITCDTPEAIEFRGWFPGKALSYRLDFTVDSGFQPAGDARELGICIPLLELRERHLQRIPFRIS